MSERSLARDVADLTSLLTRLGATRPPIAPTSSGLDAALHARAAVLALGRQVLTDMRLPASGQVPGFADLHHRPAAVMAWALEHHPVVSAVSSPIDVARTAVPGSSTALWEHAATLATRTHLRFEQLGLVGQPTAAVLAHPARGALIADLALTLDALTRCESAMAATADALGDHTRAGALQAALASPLRLAADATWRTTPMGSPAWDAVPAPDGRRLGVLPIRDAAALPQGLARLAALLHGQLDLSPQHTASLIAAQTRIALALAAHAPTKRPGDAAALSRIDAAALSAATRTGRSDPRGDVLQGPLPLQRSAVLTRPGLLAYAQALAGTWNPRDDALSTLTASDPRPLQQAGECLRALQAATARTGGASLWPLHTLVQATSGLDQVLVATCAAVDDQLTRRTWITSRPHTPDTGARPGRSDSVDALRWRPLGPGERPHVADALHAVRTARALPVHASSTGRLTALAPTSALTAQVPAALPAAVPAR